MNEFNGVVDGGDLVKLVGLRFDLLLLSIDQWAFWCEELRSIEE